MTFLAPERSEDMARISHGDYRKTGLEQGDSDSEAGLDRRLGAGGWGVPHGISLDSTGKLLLWHLPPPFRRVQCPGKRLLHDFIKLGDAGPERILGYAREWGVLWLKGRHRRVNPPPMLPTGGMIEGQAHEVRGWVGESLDLWRSYARQAKAILDIVVALQQNRPGRDEDWGILYAVREGPTLPEMGEGWSAETERAALAWHLNHWLEEGSIRPQVRLINGSLGLRWQPHTLLGGLGLALAATVSHVKGVAFCSGCGDLYTPENRRPNPNWRSLCPGCRMTVGPRLRKRDQRARERDAASQNKSVAM